MNTDYASQQRNPAKHLIGIGAVVFLHLALVWALQNGLAHKVMSLVKKPIDAKLIEEVKPKEPEQAPPPPPPKNRPPPPPPDYVPPPEIAPAASATPAANAISAVSSAPQPKVETPAPPKQVVHAVPVISAASCEKPEYPAASKRMEEEGTVVLRFLVAEDGKVLESKVDNSSGSPRLDEAARAALSKCRFKPGMADGVPERAWASMKYTWKLE